MTLEQALEENRIHMIRAALRVGCSPAEAEDAVSYATYRLLKIQDTLDYTNPGKLRGVFCAMTKQCAFNNYKKEKKNLVDNLVVDWIHNKSYKSNPERSYETTISVHEALAKMPELEREIAWKYFALEYSLQMICEDLYTAGKKGWSRQYLNNFIRKYVKPMLRANLMEAGYGRN